MKQSVSLEFQRDGSGKDTFRIIIAKAKQSQEHFINGEDPAEISIEDDRLTLTSNVYHLTTGKPEVYVFRILSENELEFFADECKDIYMGGPSLINLEHGMCFQTLKKVKPS